MDDYNRTPVNPDRRALPRGWVECYNSQKDTWFGCFASSFERSHIDFFFFRYYVQTDVFPARISYYHPATETYAEGNHLFDSKLSSTSTSTSNPYSHQQFFSDPKDEQKTASPSTYVAGAPTATTPIPIYPEPTNVLILAHSSTSAPNTADLTSPPEYSAYSELSDDPQSNWSPGLEENSSSLPPGYTNSPIVAEPPSPHIQPLQSAPTEIDRSPSVVHLSVNSRPVSTGTNLSSAGYPLNSAHMYGSSPVLNVSSSPPPPVSSPETMTLAQKLYASAFSAHALSQGSRASNSASTVYLPPDSHLSPTISLPPNPDSANSFYKPGVSRNLNHLRPGSSYHAGSLNHTSSTLSLVSSHPTQQLSSTSRPQSEYQLSTRSAPITGRPTSIGRQGPTSLPNVTLVAHPPSTGVSNLTNQISTNSPPPSTTPTMNTATQSQIGVSGIQSPLPRSSIGGMSGYNAPAAAPAVMLHPVTPSNTSMVNVPGAVNVNTNAINDYQAIVNAQAQQIQQMMNALNLQQHNVQSGGHVQAQVPVTQQTYSAPTVHPTQPGSSHQSSHHGHGSFTSVLNTVGQGLMGAMHPQSAGSTGSSGTGSNGSSSLWSTIGHEALHLAEHEALSLVEHEAVSLVEQEASSLWNQL
ncbi:hypothetical protein BDP27DRAFT_1313693 [Rhodocollybia butyracea]|uniref:Uncharacterized protein n=1 Tax=Rhodocollybia butyracea TaxID=206335 RepID=A0A9P5Q8L3_9AGAR|nr:hypothetical protein BDP27DRAFT_1313693 [Rhodocollybia butyracea]